MFLARCSRAVMAEPGYTAGPTAAPAADMFGHATPTVQHMQMQPSEQLLALVDRYFIEESKMRYKLIPPAYWIRAPLCFQQY